jgi:hypothetical protein
MNSIFKKMLSIEIKKSKKKKQCKPMLAYKTCDASHLIKNIELEKTTKSKFQ